MSAGGQRDAEGNVGRNVGRPGVDSPTPGRHLIVLGSGRHLKVKTVRESLPMR